MYALMFALARMASAAWVGAALLFVMVAVKQTDYIRSDEFALEETANMVDASGPTASDSSAPDESGVARQAAAAGPSGRPDLKADAKTKLIAHLAGPRFPLYYVTGATLVGLSWFASLFLRRRYLKFSRWVLVMMFLTSAAGMMAYDWQKVYKPLNALNADIIKNPQVTEEGQFETLHRHSMLVNGVQVLLTLLASLCLCLPGTRPEQPTILMKQ